MTQIKKEHPQITQITQIFKKEILL